MGLPGAGKTTLAKKLSKLIGAVHFNADEIRQNINKDLGYSESDRLEQAKRMKWLADKVVEAGHDVVVDFICPTDETRDAFGECFLIFMDTISAGRYEDTNQLFKPPIKYNARVTDWEGADKVLDLFK